MFSFAIVGGSLWIGLRVYQQFAATVPPSPPLVTHLLFPQFESFPARQTDSTQDSWAGQLHRVFPPVFASHPPQHEVNLAVAACGLTAAGLLLSPVLGLAGNLLVVVLDWPAWVKTVEMLRSERQLSTACLRPAMHCLLFVANRGVFSAIDVLLSALDRQQLYAAETQILRRCTQLTLEMQQREPPYAQDDSCVTFTAGEQIRVNGVVLQGTGLVERDSGPSRQTAVLSACDPIQPGDLLVAGTLQVHVKPPDSCLLTHPLSPLQMEQAPLTRVDEMTAPLVGLGALATLLAGPLTGAVVLSAQFGDNLETLLQLAQHQFLLLARSQQLWIRDIYVLEQLSQLDAVLLSADLLDRPQISQLLDGLRQRGVTAFYTLTDTLTDTQLHQAQQLGIDLLPTEQAGLPACLDALRARHTCLGFVGAGAADWLLWSSVNLSVTCGRPLNPMLPASVQIDDDLNKLCLLLDLGRDYAQTRRHIWRTTLLPGWAGLAGTLLPSRGFAFSIVIKIFAGPAAVDQLLAIGEQERPTTQKTRKKSPSPSTQRRRSPAPQHAPLRRKTQTSSPFLDSLMAPTWAAGT